MSAALAQTRPAPRTAPADLSARGIEHAFGATRVLRGVSLSVARGEAVALVGANGAGKSTLLRGLLRLIEPAEGRIQLLGCDVRALPPGDLRRLRARIGFVFQRHNLVPRMSALSNAVQGGVARAGLPALWQATAPGDLREEAMARLEEVGLADLARRRADALSGGQSQRVAIARALVQRPELLLADEPVASLDPAAGREVMELFARLARRRGLPVLFTTHHMEHAVAFADRVVGLRDGLVALDAPASPRLLPELERFFA